MLNHHLISLLLLLLYGLLVSPSSSSSSSVEKGWINNLFDLSEDEKLAISLGANSLSNYAGKHRPSCFQQAAQSLRIGCNARHISDGVKVFFAIKLTHCEIATASYATPRECQEMEQQQHQWGSSEDFEDEFNAPSSPYTASDLMEDGDPGGGSGWFIGSLKKGKKQKQQHQRSSHFHSYIDSIQGEALKCVEAFSRVPQLWTSYSGYFKEVVNMCFSVRYEIERTQLSDLYRNLTLSQLSSYRLMRDQNEEFKLWRLESLDELKQLNDLQQQNIVLSEQIEIIAKSSANASQDLINMTINTKSILSHLSTNLSEQYQSFIRINAHLQNDMEKGLVSAKETTSLVESSLGMLVKGMAQIDHIQKTQLEILDNMADLTSLTTSISRTLSDVVTSDVSLIKSRLTDLATDLDLVAKGVGGMEIRIMDSLQETFKVITTTLAISLQNLEVVQSQHAEIAGLKLSQDEMNHKWEQVVNDMTADLHTLFNSTLSHVAQLLEAVGAMHDGHQEIITFLAPVSGAFAGLRGAIYDYAMVLTFVVLSLAMALRAVTSFPWSLSTLNQLLQQMAICVTLVTVKRFYPTLHQEAVLLGICLELVLVFLRLWKLVFTRSSTVPHDSPPPPDYYTQKLSHSLLPAHSAGSFSKSVTASSSFGKDPLLECLMLLSKKVDDLSSQIGGLHNGGDGATAPVVKLKRDKSQTARRNSDTVAATRKE